MIRKLLQLFTISLIFSLTACGHEKIDSNMSGDIVNFDFTTQDDTSFGRKDLKGKWWIAYFMYTDCAIVCPTTTPHMVSLQEELNKSDSDVQIVSFTVDPEHDTPAVLRKYAQDNQANLSNWTFLTGYKFDKVKKLSEESFHSSLEGGGPEGMKYSHSTNFFLINPEGKVIKKYNGMSTKEVDKLINDVKTALK